ncbi:MAG: Wzz/FepE/Etk N-terminal domain-containing protein [Anaerolineales bacterium]|jgi:uncharacterized protein involved in exopolysaccharide biosynthesis
MQETEIFEIDLGKYIETLFRQWQLILGTVFVCALAAGLVTLSRPRTFQARALVASTKVASSVSFDTAIQTLSEEQLPTTVRMVDPQARLQSYVQLVKNPAIAQTVLDEFGSRLPEDIRDISSLLQMVKGDVAAKSDSIEILVTYKDPVLAADLANAWARAYVGHVNAIYSGEGTDEVYQSVQHQTTESKSEYDQAQAALEAFLADNQASEYQRQIGEQQAMIDSLSVGRTLSAGTIISNTMASQLTAFTEQVGNLSTQLAEVYTEFRQVDQMLLDARNMRDQVQSGGSGAVSSNTLALMLLKSQVFATNEVAPNLIVQTTPASITPEEMTADLDSLIVILENRRTELADRIQTLSDHLVNSGGSSPEVSIAGGNPMTTDQAQATLQSLSQLKGMESVANLDVASTPMEQKIQQLESQVNQLQSRLAGEQAREQELTRARDLAWDTYKTLATKQAELKVASQTQGTEVALAAPAAVPEMDAVSGAKNVALAALVGLVLGIGAAYFIEFWWSYKGLQPQPITLIGIFRGIELKPVPADNRSA